MAAGGIPLPPTRLLGAGGLALLGAALLRYCRGIKVRGAQADTAGELPWVVCEGAVAAVTAAPQQLCSQGPVTVPFLSQVPSLLADPFSSLPTGPQSSGHGPLSASEDGGRGQGAWQVLRVVLGAGLWGQGTAGREVQEEAGLAGEGLGLLAKEHGCHPEGVEPPVGPGLARPGLPPPSCCPAPGHTGRCGGTVETATCCQGQSRESGTGWACGQRHPGSACINTRSSRQPGRPSTTGGSGASGRLNYKTQDMLQKYTVRKEPRERT